MPIRTEPLPGSRWRMRGDLNVEVVGITNRHRHNPTDYPVTVVYKDDYGRLESRSLAKFKASAVCEIHLSCS